MAKTQSVPISEREIQKAVVQYIRIKYSDVIILMSPIHKTSIQQGVLNKAMGYTKGTPDIFLPYPNKFYHGLFVELKTSKGKTSPEQQNVLSKLEELKYCTAVCHSINDAIEIIDKYMIIPE